MPTLNEPSSTRADLYHPLDLRSGTVEEWVAGLPLANLGETGRLLFASLRDINANELTATQRYKTLEALRATLHYLSNALKQRFLGTAFPLTDKPRKVANLLREMQFEMANGYRVTVRQLLLQNNLRQDSDTLAASIQRSLYYFGQSFLATYQIYSDPEPLHWREVYSLYAEAERHALHLGAVRDRFKHGNPVTTINQTFKQILLLTLADPLRLTQTEMAAAYRLLETTAEQCQRHKTPDTIKSPAFMIDLDGETPPVRLLYSDVSVRETCRWLDTTALIDSVRALLAEAVSDHSLLRTMEESNDKLSRSLLQRLVAAWGTAGKRGSTRLPYRSTASVQFGLSASHEAADEQRQDVVVTARGSSSHCEIVNESAAGACLYWADNKVPRVRVGEIVTVRHADADTTQGGIGVVRWMNQPSGKGVFFGVQMLVPSATPITLRLSDKDETERDYLKGLLLPPLPPREATQTLLTPAFVYRSGDVVSVRAAEQHEQRYRLIRAVESTQVFTRFHFEPVTASENEEPPIAPQRREEEFDSVWSGL